MNDLLKTILNQVFQINEMEGYTASFRYINGDLAVDISSNKKNIYHKHASDIGISYQQPKNVFTESLLQEITSELSYLIDNSYLETKRYELTYRDEYMEIALEYVNGDEVADKKKYLDIKYNIDCVIKEVKA